MQTSRTIMEGSKDIPQKNENKSQTHSQIIAGITGPRKPTAQN